MNRVPKLRFTEFQEDWKKVSLNEIVKENIEPIPMPENDYIRIGIYCHAKGTFQEHVAKEKALNVDTMYVVHKNNLIVNITFAWEHAIAITKDIDEGKIVSHRFPTYDFRTGHLHKFYKYLILDKKFKYQLGLASPGGAGRNRVLNKGEFLKIQVYTTSEKEQEKIADFLSKVDERITVQENIISDLENQKKGLMQKLFNQEIRFKADDGSDYPKWNSASFPNVFKMLQSNTFSRDCLNYEYGIVKNIHYGDILIKFGASLQADDTRIPYVNSNIDIQRFSKESYLKEGDIVFADTAEDFTVGKSTEICNINNAKLLSGLHTIPCRPKKEFVSKYLGYYTNSERYHKQLLPLIQGIKVSSISKTSICDTFIEYPCLEEQKKIVNCLSAFDKKIEIERKILEDWQQIKKGLLQQMFV
ncbi:restriction endonuclease subunit S [Lachnospiraceae bacterium 48-33]